MSRLIVTRHAETKLNVDNRLRGTIDVPLDEKGYLETEFIAQKLCGLDIDDLYSSPMQRALVTAKAIKKYQYDGDCNLQVVEDLKPWHLGALNGRKIDEVLGQMLHLIKNNTEFPPLSNENFLMFIQRTLKVFKDCMSMVEKSGEDVCCVSHVRNIRALKAWGLAGYEDKIDLSVMLDKNDPVEPGGLYTIEYKDGKWSEVTI